MNVDYFWNLLCGSRSKKQKKRKMAGLKKNSDPKRRKVRVMAIGQQNQLKGLHIVTVLLC
jgi:hypothetical protein